ncbi:MAG TPA: GatB/YqeY domain-containing protein [Gemmatimonadaceae bacterium]|jgi:uncharacterized protein YqeY
MSDLMHRLQSDLNASRKAGDKDRTLLLGTILSDAKNREIELKRDLTDDDVVEVIRKGVKRRRESIEMYETGNRPELAAREQAEADALEEYLPAGASEEELRAAVQAAIAGGAKNIGAVMGKVMAQFKGRAEGGIINAIARQELARPG